MPQKRIHFVISKFRNKDFETSDYLWACYVTDYVITLKTHFLYRIDFKEDSRHNYKIILLLNV